MAKRRSDVDQLAVEELMGAMKPQAPAEDKRPDAAVPVTVSMKRYERDRYQQLADQHGITRSKLMRYALVWFLQQLDEGEAELEFQTEQTLRIPSQE
jgi:predicted amidophosphoribosyltransferase